MSLSILTISPEADKIDVAIDSNIVIEFSDKIDPFTVSNGISFYTLNTDLSDQLDLQEDRTYYTLSYQVQDTTLIITPSTSLLPDKEHYLSILPGNDSSRYLSIETVGTPIVVAPSGCNVEITSSYLGSDDNTLEITFNTSDGINTDTLDISKGVVPFGSFEFIIGEEVDIGELKFILTGSFDIGDSISIPVYVAEGVSDIYEIKFTTSKYTTTVPKSHKIEYVGDSDNPLKVLRTTPEDMSLNNKMINPITIKFNKQLNQDQVLTDKIKVQRIGLETGITKRIDHYYKVQEDTLKIYMLNVARG